MSIETTDTLKSEEPKCIDVYSLFNLPLTEFVMPCIDMRTREEFDNGRIPTALLRVDYNETFDLLSQISDFGFSDFEESKAVVVYYESAEFERDQRFYDDLIENGVHTIIELSGGAAAFSMVFPKIFQAPQSVQSRISLPAYIPAANIFLGSCMHAEEEIVEMLGVNAIFNAGATSAVNPRLISRYQFAFIPIVDDITQSLDPYLRTAVAFLETTLATGEESPVLVHCSQGVSRSVAIVMAYLIEHRGIGVDEALEYVRKYRKCARPNDGFMAQLKLKYNGLKSCLKRSLQPTSLDTRS